MTIRLRGSVRRPSKGGPWLAVASAIDPHTGLVHRLDTHRDSWPEAMQATHRMLADLDQHLMDQMHASRAARRDTTPTDPHTMEPTA